MPGAGCTVRVQVCGDGQLLACTKVPTLTGLLQRLRIAAT